MTDVIESVPAAASAAVVLRLPNADLPQIHQQRPRRPGPHPKCVAVLWRERFERSPRLRTMGLIAARDRALSARRECYQRYLQARLACEAAGAALNAISNEFSVLADQVKKLDAELAALHGGSGTWAVTES